MEDLDLTGIWWLPADEGNKVAGILSSSNEGIRLSLIGSFTDLTGLGTDERHPLILGLAKGGKVVTLVDCREVNASFSMPGFLSKEFLAQVAFLGAHFEETELRFHKAAIQYGHLTDWVGASGFKRNIQTTGGGLMKAELTYEYPDDAVAATEEGEVRITFAFKAGGDLVREATLRHEALIRIEANAELTLDEWFVRFVSPMQNFLTLATMRPNAVTHLTVFSATKAIATSRGEEKELPIEVYYSPVYRGSTEDKILTPYEMLFTLPDVIADFEKVVQNWLRVAQELDSVCNLFFSLAYRPNTYLEHRFLPLIQAAETYHRRRFKNRVLPRVAHRARTKAIVESVSPEHRDWLREKLNYSNEPSLSDRLQELVAATEEVSGPLIQDTEKFVRTVRDTRNYLTHYDTTLKKKAAQGAELFRLAETLSFIVQACLLRELGLPPERQAELFGRNQRYVHAVRQARLANL